MKTNHRTGFAKPQRLGFTPAAPHPRSPNQGKNPSNQGKSCLIKANAIFSNAAKRTHPLDGADRLAHGQIVYPGEILSWGRGNR